MFYRVILSVSFCDIHFLEEPFYQNSFRRTTWKRIDRKNITFARNVRRVNLRRLLEQSQVRDISFAFVQILREKINEATRSLLHKVTKHRSSGYSSSRKSYTEKGQKTLYIMKNAKRSNIDVATGKK